MVFGVSPDKAFVKLPVPFVTDIFVQPVPPTVGVLFVELYTKPRASEQAVLLPLSVAETQSTEATALVVALVLVTVMVMLLVAVTEQLPVVAVTVSL